MRLLLALALLAGCKKQQEAPPPPDDRPPSLSEIEIKRGQDACNAYVDQVCACTAPQAAETCALAKMLPDALRVGLETSVSPDSKRRDVLQANDIIRKTIAECIERTAKLPSLGC